MNSLTCETGGTESVRKVDRTVKKMTLLSRGIFTWAVYNALHNTEKITETNH